MVNKLSEEKKKDRLRESTCNIGKEEKETTIYGLAEGKNENNPLKQK